MKVPLAFDERDVCITQPELLLALTTALAPMAVALVMSVSNGTRAPDPMAVLKLPVLL